MDGLNSRLQAEKHKFCNLKEKSIGNTKYYSGERKSMKKKKQSMQVMFQKMFKILIYL